MTGQKRKWSCRLKSVANDPIPDLALIQNISGLP
jgi:hypothetical protein